MYLKNVLYPGTSHIVWSYIEKDEKNFERMRKIVVSHKKIFQYVYANCYSEIFLQVEKRGIDFRNQYLITFKVWKDKKQNLKINQQQPTAESNKDEIYSMRKLCKNIAPDDEFLEKKKDEIIAKKVLERKEKRKLLSAKNKELKRTKKVKQEQYIENQGGIQGMSSQSD